MTPVLYRLKEILIDKNAYKSEVVSAGFDCLLFRSARRNARQFIGYVRQVIAQVVAYAG